MANFINKIIKAGRVLIDLTADTVTAAQVLSGVTFHDKSGASLTGTMVNNGAVSPSALNSGGSYTIPAGYHNGSGKVTVNSLASQTPGDAGAGDILASKKAWVSGSQITGNIPTAPTYPNENTASDLHLYGTSPNTQGNNIFALVPKGYYNNVWLGYRDMNLIPANIKNGVEIGGGLKLTGTFTSDGTIGAGDVLSGKIGYSKGSKITGTMTNQGAVNGSVNAGGTYTIPAGYHNGSGKVTGNSLSSQTSADAGAANILKNKTAWVNGSKITGTMTDNGTVSPAGLNAGGSYTIPAGYHSGSGKVTANSLSSQTDATAGAGDIFTGKTAWVNGSKITGTMANQGAVSPGALNAGGSYTIPAGYHNGSGIVTAAALSGQTSATAAAADILSGKTAWVNGIKLTGTMEASSGGGGAVKTWTGTVTSGSFVTVDLRQFMPMGNSWTEAIIMGDSWIDLRSASAGITHYYYIIIISKVVHDSQVYVSCVTNRVVNLNLATSTFLSNTHNNLYFNEVQTGSAPGWSECISKSYATTMFQFSTASTTSTTLFGTFGIAKGKSVSVPYHGTFSTAEYKVTLTLI